QVEGVKSMLRIGGIVSWGEPSMAACEPADDGRLVAVIGNRVAVQAEFGPPHERFLHRGRAFEIHVRHPEGPHVLAPEQFQRLVPFVGAGVPPVNTPVVMECHGRRPTPFLASDLDTEQMFCYKGGRKENQGYSGESTRTARTLASGHDDGHDFGSM